MAVINEIKNLPYELIIILAFGYLGYLIFTRKKASKERTYEVWFKVLFFSLPTIGILKGCGWELSGIGAVKILFCSLVTTVPFAFLLKLIASKYMSQERSSRLGASTGHATTWDAFTDETGGSVSKIKIFLTNGDVLISNLFDVPGAIVKNKFHWDEDGNMAIYITKLHKKDKSIDDVGSVDFKIDAKNYGPGLTFVPTEQIRRVTVHKL